MSHLLTQFTARYMARYEDETTVDRTQAKRDPGLGENHGGP
jgi:hypothetical protein